MLRGRYLIWSIGLFVLLGATLAIVLIRQSSDQPRLNLQRQISSGEPIQCTFTLLERGKYADVEVPRTITTNVNVEDKDFSKLRSIIVNVDWTYWNERGPRSDFTASARVILVEQSSGKERILLEFHPGGFLAVRSSDGKETRWRGGDIFFELLDALKERERQRTGQ